MFYKIQAIILHLKSLAPSVFRTHFNNVGQQVNFSLISVPIVDKAAINVSEVVRVSVDLLCKRIHVHESIYESKVYIFIHFKMLRGMMSEL